MPRVKGGYTTRRRRKAILKLAKGYFGSKRTLFRTAHEQVMRSLAYSYRDRKQRKREFRKLWIARINAACKANEYKYSLLISGLKKANVLVNRKVLAELAIFDPVGFKDLIEMAKKGNAGECKKVEVKAEVKKAPAKKEVVAEEAKIDLTSLKVAELKEMAKAKGIEVTSTMKKADLIAALS